MINDSIDEPTFDDAVVEVRPPNQALEKVFDNVFETVLRVASVEGGGVKRSLNTEGLKENIDHLKGDACYRRRLIELLKEQKNLEANIGENFEDFSGFEDLENTETH
ncbi:MAG: hypothetical protein H0W44_08365 [Gammaproteobacteria bacterium]|nr:hypothetical protein [Gammaproteobacteria bacterium]